MKKNEILILKMPKILDLFLPPQKLVREFGMCLNFEIQGSQSRKFEYIFEVWPIRSLDIITFWNIICVIVRPFEKSKIWKIPRQFIHCLTILRIHYLSCIQIHCSPLLPLPWRQSYVSACVRVRVCVCVCVCVCTCIICRHLQQI